MKLIAPISLLAAALAPVAAQPVYYPGDLHARDAAQLQRIGFQVSRHVVAMGGIVSRTIGSLRSHGDAVADVFADWEEAKPRLPQVLVGAYDPCAQQAWNAMLAAERAVVLFQSRAGVQPVQQAIDAARAYLWQATSCRQAADAYIANLVINSFYPLYNASIPAYSGMYFGNGRWLITSVNGYQYYWEENRGDGVVPPAPREIALLNPVYRGDGMWDYTLPDGQRTSMIQGEMDDTYLFPRVAPPQVTTNACAPTVTRRPGSGRPARCVQPQSRRIATEDYGRIELPREVNAPLQ